MNDIQRTTSANSMLTPMLKNFSPLERVQSEATPQTKSVALDISISAEAQYLFQVDSYLQDLNENDRQKALDYLSQSDDPLLGKAAEHYREGQETRINLTVQQTQNIMAQRDERIANGKNLLAPQEDITDSTRVVVLPLSTGVFRLDENKNFVPITLAKFNTELSEKLDSLEPSAYDELDNQDAANLIGAVREALSASENILTSFDDVLHYNYSIAKANEAIRFVDAPEKMKSQLTDLLNEGLAYQNDKQTQFIADTSRLMSDARVGGAATQDVRLATAAQRYNGQLQNTLKETGLPVLNAGGILNKLLVDNTDLIRFAPSKINDALEYYKQDYANFQKALDKDFSQPEPNVAPLLDTTALNNGSDYALKVISQIESYVLKS